MVTIRVARAVSRPVAPGRRRQSDDRAVSQAAIDRITGACIIDMPLPEPR